jgi:hypothetical protein
LNVGADPEAPLVEHEMIHIEGGMHNDTCVKGGPLYYQAFLKFVQHQMDIAALKLVYPSDVMSPVGAAASGASQDQ